MTKTNQRELKRHRLQLMDGGHCYLDVWIDHEAKVCINRMPARLNRTEVGMLHDWLANVVETLATTNPDRDNVIQDPATPPED